MSSADPGAPDASNTVYIIVISCVATIGGFLFGFDSGVINGTVDGLRSAFDSDSVGTGFNVASMLLGCAAGAFFAGRLADRFGKGLRGAPRDALIAVRMNDAPLPAIHGFPARLIVPGLYGYVSATKWIEEIELTTWDGFDGYWISRGALHDRLIEIDDAAPEIELRHGARPGHLTICFVSLRSA